MKQSDKSAQRQAAWSKPRAEGTTQPTAHQERDMALATLLNTPGWEALKGLIQEMAPFRVPETSDVQFDVKLHEAVFRSQFAVQIQKAVVLAAEREKARKVAPKPEGQA